MGANPTNPIDDPLPRSPSIEKTPGYGPENVDEGIEKNTPRQFEMPPAGPEGGEASKQTESVSPMQLAGQTQAGQRMTPEQLSSHVDKLRSQLNEVTAKLQDTNLQNKLTDDHISAIKQVVKKMNPDMRSIANETGGKFQAANVEGDKSSVLSSVTNWINGSQEALGGALNYLSQKKGDQSGVNPAEFLKLQYSVQRATQRGELFSSIISSSVSGIKTIMSTQLG